MVAAYSSGARFETKRIESENLDWVRKEYLINYIPFDFPFQELPENRVSLTVKGI